MRRIINTNKYKSRTEELKPAKSWLKEIFEKTKNVDFQVYLEEETIVKEDGIVYNEVVIRFKEKIGNNDDQ